MQLSEILSHPPGTHQTNRICRLSHSQNTVILKNYLKNLMPAVSKETQKAHTFWHMHFFGFFAKRTNDCKQQRLILAMRQINFYLQISKHLLQLFQDLFMSDAFRDLKKMHCATLEAIHLIPTQNNKSKIITRAANAQLTYSKTENNFFLSTGLSSYHPENGSRPEK